MKIIINALSGIGDAIMFSPALKLLKKHLPEAQIDMLAMFYAVKNIYERNPAVNKVYFIDFLHQSSLKSIKNILALRKNHYDASVNVYPSNRREYNILNRMLGAKKRIASKYNHYSAINFDFLNNNLIQEIKDRHNVIENYELIKLLAPDTKEEELSGYDIYLNDNDKKSANDYTERNKLNNKFLVGFHAGSATFKGHINKRWDAGKYAELAIRLNKKYGAVILLFGTEKEVNRYIMDKSAGAALIPGETNITESIALMGKCSLFVSNDAALMHIAAGLKIPTVAIFGYTNYKELSPWKTKNIIVRKVLECSPCFFNSPKPVNCIFSGEDEFKCIKTISVEEVFSACNNLIKEIPGYIKP